MLQIHALFNRLGVEYDIDVDWYRYVTFESKAVLKTSL